MNATMINERLPANRAAHDHSTCFMLSQRDPASGPRSLALHRSKARYHTPTRLPRWGGPLSGRASCRRPLKRRTTKPATRPLGSLGSAYGTIASRSSTWVTPGAAQAARSAS